MIVTIKSIKIFMYLIGVFLALLLAKVGIQFILLSFDCHNSFSAQFLFGAGIALLLAIIGEICLLISIFKSIKKQVETKDNYDRRRN